MIPKTRLLRPRGPHRGNTEDRRADSTGHLKMDSMVRLLRVDMRLRPAASSTVAIHRSSKGMGEGIRHRFRDKIRDTRN